MKSCELCEAKARIHCVSDQASLCWGCDAKVHSANFLVARHSRSLLCHVCQSPMRWSASGCNLGHTVSICEQCVDRGRCDDSGEEESEDEVKLEVVEENQVVPWSPPPTESSSSMDGAVSDGGVSRKRFRIDGGLSNHHFKEGRQSCASSSDLNIRNPLPSDLAPCMAEAYFRRESAPSRKTRTTESGRVEVLGSGVLDSLRRFHPEETGLGEEMTEICTSPGPSV